MRKSVIGFLCHFYPAFVTAHLIWGNWSRISQVIFNVVPIAVFSSLFTIWKNTSHIRLDKHEQRFLGYLTLMLTLIYCYYIICLFADRGWIANHNAQFAIFISATLVFYLYAYSNEIRRWLKLFL